MQKLPIPAGVDNIKRTRLHYHREFMSVSPPPEIPRHINQDQSPLSSLRVTWRLSGGQYRKLCVHCTDNVWAGMYLESCNCNPILYLPSSPSEAHSQGQKVGRLSEWERETENQYDIEFYPRLVTLLTDTPRYCYFKTCLAVIPLSVQCPGQHQTCHKGSPACLLCVTTRYFSYIIIPY